MLIASTKCLEDLAFVCRDLVLLLCGGSMIEEVDLFGWVVGGFRRDLVEVVRWTEVGLLGLGFRHWSCFCLYFCIQI